MKKVLESTKLFRSGLYESGLLVIAENRLRQAGFKINNLIDFALL